MRNFERRMPLRRQRLREFGEFASSLFGNLRNGALGMKFLRVGKQPTQFGERFRQCQIIQRKGECFAGCVGEMRVNLQDVGITHHQERRIVQRQRVGHELLERYA